MTASTIEEAQRGFRRAYAEYEFSRELEQLIAEKIRYHGASWEGGSPAVYLVAHPEGYLIKIIQEPTHAQ